MYRKLYSNQNYIDVWNCVLPKKILFCENCGPRRMAPTLTPRGGRGVKSSRARESSRPTPRALVLKNFQFNSLTSSAPKESHFKIGFVNALSLP